MKHSNYTVFRLQTPFRLNKFLNNFCFTAELNTHKMCRLPIPQFYGSHCNHHTSGVLMYANFLCVSLNKLVTKKEAIDAHNKH